MVDKLANNKNHIFIFQTDLHFYRKKQLVGSITFSNLKVDKIVSLAPTDSYLKHISSLKCSKTAIVEIILLHKIYCTPPA